MSIYFKPIVYETIITFFSKLDNAHIFYGFMGVCSS